jgi:hypothetical protein
MKRILLALAVLASVSTVASADPPQHRTRKQIKRAVKRLIKFERAIDRLDTNGDGKLSQDEVGDKFQRFQRFDRNGDGWITAEEVLAGPVRGKQARDE